MHDRTLYLDLWRELAGHKSMIFLVGPRQAGKTTLASLRAERHALAGCMIGRNGNVRFYQKFKGVLDRLNLGFGIDV